MCTFFESSWREPSQFARGLCAVVATFGIAISAYAGDDPACPNPKGGDCLTETPGVAGCQDAVCCNLVCDVDPRCCLEEWIEDFTCVSIAAGLCEIEPPCDGEQAVYSNITNFNGAGTSSSQGAMITADDLFVTSGGVVTEITFSIVNFNLAAPHGPTGELTDGMLTIFLIDYNGGFGTPNAPNVNPSPNEGDGDDVFVIIEVPLAGLFDGSVEGADPLPANNGTLITITFEPEDGIVVPPGAFWAGIRPDSAVFQNTPAGGNDSVNHLGQFLMDPIDVGDSANVFWRQGFGLSIFGGATPPNAFFAWEFQVICGPGACCFVDDGSCELLEEVDCTDQGGLFVGPGIPCEDVTCPVAGACCLVGGGCVDGITEGECTAVFGGTFQGDTTSCPGVAGVNCVAGCQVTCTGTAEGEACGQALNQGCNVPEAPVFGSIDCGETVCGSSFADEGTRDNDWYLIDVPAVDGTGMTRVNVSIASEFPADVFLVDVTDCAALVFPDPDNNGLNVAADCTGDTMSVCVPAGQYAVFVGVADENGPLFDGFPCGGGANDYSLSVQCVACGAGPACPVDCVGSDFAPPADGNVDGFDLAVLLGSWSPGPCQFDCCMDVVGSNFLPPPDGVVDGFDLAVLLGAWGNPGCPSGWPPS